MGTQTQDPNRQNQGGADKKAPSNDPKAPHDPKLPPQRDQGNGSERRTDQNQNQQRDQSGSRKRSSTENPDADADDEDDDESTDQPGKGGAIDEGGREGNRGGNR